MYVKYAQYQHDANLSAITFRKEIIRDRRQNPIFLRKRATVEVTLTGASQSALNTKIEALEAAYDRDGKGDWALYQDDGTITEHSMINNQSYNGIQILDIDYPEGSGAEFATRRTAVISLQADFPQTLATNVVLWNETFRVTGNGGPRIVTVTLKTGVPQRQQLTEATPVRAVQSGNSVGFAAPLSYPQPMVSTDFLDNEGFDQSSGAPENNGREFLNYPRSWSYTFTVPFPIGVVHPLGR